MLNQETLIKTLKLQESIRRMGGKTSEGSCFGTPLSDRLRPSFETITTILKQKREKTKSKDSTPIKPPEEIIDLPF